MKPTPYYWRRVRLAYVPPYSAPLRDTNGAKRAPSSGAAHPSKPLACWRGSTVPWRTEPHQSGIVNVARRRVKEGFRWCRTDAFASLGESLGGRHRSVTLGVE